MGNFQPKRGLGIEAAVEHIEVFLSRARDFTSRTSGGGTGSNVTVPLGKIPENDVIFDPLDGHQHTGVDSHTVDHANLVNVLPDQHHVQLHNLLSADHPDTLAASAAAGSLVMGNATPKWSALARGTSGFFLKAGASVLSWVQVNFTDLAGTLQTGQHGTLSDGDHTGDLTGNARVGVRKNTGGSTFKRRRLNFIEGTNVTITIADDSGNEEVDVTIAASGGGGAGAINEGTYAARPAFGTAGYAYYATDVGLWRDTGFAWDKVSDPDMAGEYADLLPRLSLVSNDWCSVSDQIGKSTLYAIGPSDSGFGIHLWYNSEWVWFGPKSGVSLALSGLTSGLNYDVYMYASTGPPSGTVALELVAWTSDTSRAGAGYPTEFGNYPGRWCKQGDQTRRFIGTIRTTATATTEDSRANRFVYSLFNQFPRELLMIDTTDTWTYSTATWRQWRATATNQVAVVNGEPRTASGLNNLIALHVHALVSASAAGLGVGTGIGEDSTSVRAADIIGGRAASYVINVETMITAQLIKNVAQGYHFYAALERGSGAGTETWQGDGGSPGNIQCGMNGIWWC